MLTNEQVDRVRQYLAEIHWRSDLQPEILDHLCCEIEQQLENGATFEAAYTKAIQLFQPNQLRRLDRRLFFTNQLLPMLTKISTVLIIALAYTFLSPANDFVPAPEVPVAMPVSELESAAVAMLEPAFDPPSASPLAGVELKDAHSGFGMRLHPLTNKQMLHKGIDFPAPTGTKVMATAAGEVIFAGMNGPHGIQVIIQHADGYSTSYTHLSLNTVEVGQTVKLGEKVGEVGSTGRSTGPHLHYEVRKDEVAINPLAALE